MAALALISTEFRGVDDAVLWITERVEGKMLHPFVGFFPSGSGMIEEEKGVEDQEAQLLS